MTRKRRTLVLSHEGARHPFRRSLPARVFAPVGGADPVDRTRLTGEDWRGILAAYCTAFVMVFAWIV